MPARNWDADRRRRKRAEVIQELALQARDTYQEPIFDELDDARPICLICSKPVTMDGDDSHQLSSGSWTHQSCIEIGEEAPELSAAVPESQDLKIFDIEVEFTHYKLIRVLAGEGIDPRSLIREGEVLDEEISDVSMVVTEVES